MMCREHLAFWCCCAFLFVVSSSKHQLNSNNNKKNDSTVQYELDTNFMKNYDGEMEIVQFDLHENSTKDVHDRNWKNDSIRYEFKTHFMKNHENDNQTLVESYINSTKIKEDFTLHEIHQTWMKYENENGSTSKALLNNFKTDNNKNNNFVPYDMCNNITCIQLCCLAGNHPTKEKCIANVENEYLFSNLYNYINYFLQNKNKRASELFQLIIHDPCEETDRTLIYSMNNYSKYTFLANGSLYFSYYDILIESTSYCLTVRNQSRFYVTFCPETAKKIMVKELSDPNSSINRLMSNDKLIIFVILRFTSMLLLFITFLMYFILPELRSTHSFILRNYSGSMFVAYMIDIVNNPIKTMNLTYSTCVTVAIISYFCFLSTSFWLSVMSFDMWWTFRDFNSLQRNIKHRQKKKLFTYSVYAWGSPFILTIVCVIMDFVPSVPKNLIRPRFGTFVCWFNEFWALWLYYWLPALICVYGSICLLIFTAVKIARYEKDTTRQLNDLESRLYDENKKWFKLYQKLFVMVFIVMGIAWFMAALPPKFTSWYLLYTVYSLDIIQNSGIFIIFVCKKSIKQLLLKRLGCRNRNMIPKTRQTVVVTDSSTCTTTSGKISLWEKINFYKQANRRPKNLSDQTDL